MLQAKISQFYSLDPSLCPSLESRHTFSKNNFQISFPYLSPDVHLLLSLHSLVPPRTHLEILSIYPSLLLKHLYFFSPQVGFFPYFFLCFLFSASTIRVSAYSSGLGLKAHGILLPQLPARRTSSHPSNSQASPPFLSTLLYILTHPVLNILKAKTNIILILQRKVLRSYEIVQHDRQGKQNQDLNPGSQSLSSYPSQAALYEEHCLTNIC